MQADPAVRPLAIVVIAILLFAGGFAKGLFWDYWNAGAVGNIAVTLMVSALLTGLMGYLGSLVVLNQRLAQHMAQVRRL